MADFYSEMNQVARELLAPTSAGGLGQGELLLARTIPGTANPDTPWIPPAPTKQTETLNGAVKGVSSRLVGTEVGSTVILASDREAIVAVPAMGYSAGDVLSVDGLPVHIISVQNIPAAGITAAVRFIIRG